MTHVWYNSIRHAVDAGRKHRKEFGHSVRINEGGSSCSNCDWRCILAMYSDSLLSVEDPKESIARRYGKKP